MWQSLLAGLNDEQQQRVVSEAIQLLRSVSTDVTRDRSKLRVRAHQAVLDALQSLGWSTNDAQVAALVTEVVSRVSGLGFLDGLLDPEKYTEIALNPDGSVFVQKRDARYMEPLDYRPSLDEAMRLAEALAGMAGQQLSVANPTVNVKIMRRTEEGFGGARVKILHPVLLVGEGYPSITVRLFYPRRVLPDDLIAWGVAPEGVIRGLVELVARKARIKVVGPTGSGKTTLLSALCEGIPREARIVKIEDPEEIFLDHPNVVTIEPFYPSRAERHSAMAYTISDALADAMRMRPDWLIVGEVRRGNDAMNLFRAQTTGHPGLTSLHAFDMDSLITTLETLVYVDMNVGKQGAKSSLAMAVDVVVHIDWLDDNRRVIQSVWELEPRLRGGDVKFRLLYEHGAGKETLEPVQRRLLGD